MSKGAHRTLRSETEIRAYLHRTRMEMLACLRPGPATLSQLGERMGVHPANLTRHMRTLVEAGLAELVEKRDTGRNLEKYYRASAQSFDVAPELDATSSAHTITLGFVRSDISAALARLTDDDERPVLALVAGARISERDIAAFQRELTQLVERFDRADGPTGDTYHLSAALYPSDVEPMAEEIRLARPEPRS